MQGDPTLGYGHFSKVTDAPQMVGAGQRHDASAVLRHALKRHGHGLHAHHLAKAVLAVQAQQHAGVDLDGHIGIG